MTYQEIQDMIVSTFWSEGLKKYIWETGYVFPPEKLLCLAYKQSGNYTKRLEAMKLFIAHVPKAADHALLVIEWMERCLAAYRETDDNTVFEVRVDSDGTDDSIRYLCTTFDSCRDVIAKHYAACTWDKETDKACYTICKQRVLRPGEPIALYEEQYAELGPGGTIAHIPTGMTCEYGDCECDCQDCPHPCVDSTEDLIPEWIPDLSPVQYRDIRGEVCFGCVLSGGSDSWEVYVIPLTSGMFKDGLEQHADFLDHEHVSWPNVEVITPNELPQVLRQNYDTFTAFWKAQYPETYGK